MKQNHLIARAKQLLDAGELVAIPTETVYGLAADATNLEAVDKIYKVKGRPSNNPVILHFASLEAATPYILDITEEAQKLAAAFWPGPLTLLLPKSAKVSDRITAGLPRVAIRVPNNELTLTLLGQLSYPLAAPSANPSGYISPTTAEHVTRQLGHKVSLVLDGGPCDQGLESTIFGWDEEGRPTVYRKGTITEEAIAQVLHSIPRTHTTKTIEAPGMLSSHYAPHTRTLITEDLVATIEEHKDTNFGVIALDSKMETKGLNHLIVLSIGGHLPEAASNLYSAMHQMDTKGLDLIIIEKAPDIGIGKAINDRILRATGGIKKKAP